MPLKVLVFESDPSFAGELRSELSQLGLEVRIVDDGNAGLIAAASERPDLILLSIELPRMNGFSVCNKLKKDPALKDVPLIIMSSESSDETFEQHKKLRTRAEDYVHKPIAFGELLEHMRPYVQLDTNGAASSDDGIAFDDEIELEEVEEFDDVEELTQHHPRPSAPPPSGSTVDAEVEAFADSAFDHLLDEGRGSADRSAPENEPAAALETVPFESPFVENGVRRPTSRPPSTLFDVDSERLRGELDRQTSEAQQQSAEARRLAAELAAARAEIQRLEQASLEDTSGDEIVRLQRELDELRQRAATPVKASGVSSRDFLDLREALNKKDKEILGLRDQISRKEKELLDTSDTGLALEREKADLEDRIAFLERDLQAARFAADSAKADKEQAVKRADDWKARSDKVKTELEARISEAVALHATLQARVGEREARISELEAELTHQNERVGALSDQLRRDVDASEERGRAALEDAQHRAEEQLQNAIRELEAARDHALAKLREEADLARAAALASREYELNQAHEARTFELERAHADSEARLRDELGRAGFELDAVRARFQELELRRQQELDDLQRKTDHERAGLEARHADEVRDLVAQHADVSSELAKRTEEREGLAREAAELRNKVGSVEASMREATGELANAQAKLGAATRRLEELSSRWEQNRFSLERAKDALAAAVAQIEEAEARGVD
jgi:CheY-like chemotaxis protein